LNLNISDSRQNIKNLVGTFGALHVGNIHANFQASCFPGMGKGMRRWMEVTPFLALSLYKISKVG